MNVQLGKIAGSHLPLGSGSFPRPARRSSLRDNPNYDPLPRLGRKELIKETQKIMLRFSIKEGSELQDTTDRAVESQRNGESAISLLAVANMCRSSEKARSLFAPLFGFGRHYSDPEFMEGLEKVFQGYLRQQEATDEIGYDASEHEDLFEARA